MIDMIERVAKAICAAKGPRRPETNWTSYVGQARAAVKAIRDGLDEYGGEDALRILDEALKQEKTND